MPKSRYSTVVKAFFFGFTIIASGVLFWTRRAREALGLRRRKVRLTSTWAREVLKGAKTDPQSMQRPLIPELRPSFSKATQQQVHSIFYQTPSRVSFHLSSQDS